MSLQRSTPAPFLTKTYQLVDDASTDDVISWSQSGNTFVVWKHAHFSIHLLPKYFKHNNFSSFVRQLNTYGFRKTVPGKWEFAHEYFKRGERNLLGEIKRRKTMSETAGSGKSGFVGRKRWASESGGEEMGSTTTGSVEGGRREYACENEKLKKENEKLSSELRREKKQCQELVILLRKSLKVCPERCGSSYDAVRFDHQNQSECGSLKLFGVWLKGEVGKDNKDIGNCRQHSIAVYHACKKL